MNIENETAPPRVQASLDFFQRNRLWHVVSRNSRATSCKDAAARRSRLGMTGIPLHDELKSLCVVVYRADHTRCFALLQARATSRFDLKLAGMLLGAVRPLARMSAEEMNAEFATAYGSVNPFSEASKFTQVFDEDVYSAYSPPNTMMTNLGEHTWAVEFQPASLIAALKKEAGEVLVGKITEQAGKEHKLPVIGIITGNGPESGMALWRHINDRVFQALETGKKMYGDLSFPRVIVHSLPEMGLSMELALREDAVWAVLEKAVHDLCKAGATHLALACNTTPYFAPQIQAICEQYQAQFVSIADVSYQTVVSRKLDDITLIGIPLVAEMGERSPYHKLATLDVKPVEVTVLNDLLELGYMVKRMSLSGQDTKVLNKLQHIIRGGVKTKRVLIALTEISVLLERFPRLRERINGIEVIDPLRIYGEYLADQFLQAMPQGDADEFDEQQDSAVLTANINELELYATEPLMA